MAERAQAISEERCEGIGRVVVCLYYLSNQARTSNMPDLAKMLDQAISDAARMGQDAYRQYLQDAKTGRSAETAFIEHFCPVSDDATKLDLREILHRYGQNI